MPRAADGHRRPDTSTRTPCGSGVTALRASRSSSPGFLRRHRRGRLRHPASTRRPPAGQHAAGHRGAVRMSSPTSTRLRFAGQVDRSGAPRGRSQRSGGCAAPGPAPSSSVPCSIKARQPPPGRSRVRPGAVRPGEDHASICRPEPAARCPPGRSVPPARAGVRASTVHRTVARQVRASRLRPPVGTCQHRCRGVSTGSGSRRARAPTCPPHPSRR